MARYSVNDFVHLVNRIITFEVDVNKSALGEAHQSPILFLQDTKITKKGGQIVGGFNLVRYNPTIRSIEVDPNSGYRSFSIDKIKYGTLKVLG